MHYSRSSCQQKGKCDCPANCEEVIFETKESTIQIDVEQECQNDRPRRLDLKHYVTLKWKNDIDKFGSLFWRLHQLLHNRNISITSIRRSLTKWEHMSREDQIYICQEYLRNDLSLVEVEVAVPQMQRIKRERRVTFTDQLGTLGN